MAVPNLNYDLSQDLSNGQTAFFKDITVDYGVGGNISYSGVKAVRLLFFTFENRQNPTSLANPDSLVQYQQYIKTSVTTSVYDLKTLGLADFFIPFISGLTVLTGDTFNTTGIFSQYISPATYLPTNAHNILNLTPAYWGLTDTVFPDTIYGLQYEIYQDTSPSVLSNVTSGKQYVVVGTTGTCGYNGNTYRIGEVFIASSNGGVTFTGDANLKILTTSINKYYTFLFNIEWRLNLLVLNKQCSCDKFFSDKICHIQLEIDALKGANYANWTSAVKALQTIVWLQDMLTQLEADNIQ